MEPLSKEEIEDMEDWAREYFDPVIPIRWQRLFYTARLGAEFVKQTQKVLDSEAKQV